MQTPTAQAIVPDPIAIPMRQINGDFVLFVDAAHTYVSSKSRPGSFRTVDLVAGSCSCEAGVHGVGCHHLRSAREVAELDRETAVPVESTNACARCGTPLAAHLAFCDPCRDAIAAAKPRCGCGNPWTIRITGVYYCGLCSPNAHPLTAEESMALGDRAHELRFGIAANE